MPCPEARRKMRSVMSQRSAAPRPGTGATALALEVRVWVAPVLGSRAAPVTEPSKLKMRVPVPIERVTGPGRAGAQVDAGLFGDGPISLGGRAGFLGWCALRLKQSETVAGAGGRGKQEGEEQERSAAEGHARLRAAFGYGRISAGTMSAGHHWCI